MLVSCTETKAFIKKKKNLLSYSPITSSPWHSNCTQKLLYKFWWIIVPFPVWWFKGRKSVSVTHPEAQCKANGEQYLGPDKGSQSPRKAKRHFAELDKTSHEGLYLVHFPLLWEPSLKESCFIISVFLVPKRVSST